MPQMSRNYCLTTPNRKMGFSARLSCKAQGLLKRTSRKNKGKYIVSPKYKSRKIKKINKSLYSNGKNKPQIRSGYKSKEMAKITIKNLKEKSRAYQKQIVNTMYNRAKYHKYQTKDMKSAMKIYKQWLDKK